MRRILYISLYLMFALTMQAQKDITTFKGVPVDGNRQAVVVKLKANGCKSGKKNNLITDFADGRYNVKVLSGGKGVYQVRLTDMEVTENLDSIINRYNSLVDWFRNNPYYTEYEYNRYIYRGNDDTHIKYINENWYYAEFFQKAKDGHEELYSKPVSFYLTGKDGDYRIVICFENRNNMPNNMRQ